MAFSMALCLCLASRSVALEAFLGGLFEWCLAAALFLEGLAPKGPAPCPGKGLLGFLPCKRCPQEMRLPFWAVWPSSLGLIGPYCIARLSGLASGLSQSSMPEVWAGARMAHIAPRSESFLVGLITTRWELSNSPETLCPQAQSSKFFEPPGPVSRTLSHSVIRCWNRGYAAGTV